MPKKKQLISKTQMMSTKNVAGLTFYLGREYYDFDLHSGKAIFAFVRKEDVNLDCLMQEYPNARPNGMIGFTTAYNVDQDRVFASKDVDHYNTWAYNMSRCTVSPIDAELIPLVVMALHSNGLRVDSSYYERGLDPKDYTFDEAHAVGTTAVNGADFGHVFSQLYKDAATFHFNVVGKKKLDPTEPIYVNKVNIFIIDVWAYMKGFTNFEDTQIPHIMWTLKRRIEEAGSTGMIILYDRGEPKKRAKKVVSKTGVHKPETATPVEEPVPEEVPNIPAE